MKNLTPISIILLIATACNGQVIVPKAPAKSRFVITNNTADGRAILTSQTALQDRPQLYKRPHLPASQLELVLADSAKSDLSVVSAGVQAAISSAPQPTLSKLPREFASALNLSEIQQLLLNRIRS